MLQGTVPPTNQHRTKLLHESWRTQRLVLAQQRLNQTTRTHSHGQRVRSQRRMGLLSTHRTWKPRINSTCAQTQLQKPTSPTHQNLNLQRTAIHLLGLQRTTHNRRLAHHLQEQYTPSTTRHTSKLPRKPQPTLESLQTLRLPTHEGNTLRLGLPQRRSCHLRTIQLPQWISYEISQRYRAHRSG